MTGSGRGGGKTALFHRLVTLNGKPFWFGLDMATTSSQTVTGTAFTTHVFKCPQHGRIAMTFTNVIPCPARAICPTCFPPKVGGGTVPPGLSILMCECAKKSKKGAFSDNRAELVLRLEEILEADYGSSALGLDVEKLDMDIKTLCYATLTALRNEEDDLLQGGHLYDNTRHRCLNCGVKRSMIESDPTFYSPCKGF